MAQQEKPDMNKDNKDSELDNKSNLPTDEFLSKHINKSDVLLKFGITEMIYKKDLSRTQLIGVLKYISNLR